MPVCGLLCGLARRIVLQDGGHKRQVQAPSSHICAQQNALLAAPKVQEGLRALHLQPGTHHQPPLRMVPALLRGWQVPASFWQLLAQVNQAGSGQAARLYRGCTTAFQVHRHHGSVLPYGEAHMACFGKVLRTAQSAAALACPVYDVRLTGWGRQQIVEHIALQLAYACTTGDVYKLSMRCCCGRPAVSVCSPYLHSSLHKKHRSRGQLPVSCCHVASRLDMAAVRCPAAPCTHQSADDDETPPAAWLHVSGGHCR